MQRENTIKRAQRAGGESRRRSRLETRDYETARELSRLIDGGSMGYGVESTDYYKTVNDAERARLRAALDRLAGAAGVNAADLWEKTVPAYRIFKAVAYALADLRAQGRPDVRAEKAADRLRADASRHERARLQLNSYQPDGVRRHPPFIRDTVRHIDEVTRGGMEVPGLGALCDVLALWARFMLEIDPSFASTLYIALQDGWKENRRGLYDKENFDDERDRSTVAFHGLTLNVLRRLRGERTYFATQDADALAVMRRELQAMRERIEDAAAGSVPKPDDASRLTELRDRLGKLDRDDITNSTAALRLEKEIYDIEHPPDDLDDWSAWEEGGDS